MSILSKRFSNTRQLELKQILDTLPPTQEILILGREGEKKTEIDTVKYIKKTEKQLMTKQIERMYVQEFDNYLVIVLKNK